MNQTGEWKRYRHFCSPVFILYIITTDKFYLYFYTQSYLYLFEKIFYGSGKNLNNFNTIKLYMKCIQEFSVWILYAQKYQFVMLSEWS